MFSSTLRRYSPSIARISFSSIRSLTSYTPTRTVIRNSLKHPPTAPFLQHRFFSASPFLKNDTEAEQELAEELTVDSDPPAGEYVHHPGDPEITHHYGKDEPITRFQQLADKGLVDPVIIEKIVKGKGYEEMTKVQRKTILETLGGEDVFGQAKTGTGKTFAFLLPLIQRIRTTTIPFKPYTRFNFRAAPRQGETNADVRAIIISPTRELAQQIEVDARFLTQGTKIITQLAVGGSGKRESLASIRDRGCHILVATPGRLHDILSDPQADISTQNLETLVLDEADHLLDQGFAEEIYKIINLLPSRDAPVGNTGKPRQTLLFSATIPDKVLSMAKKTMRRGHKFLQMVEKGETATHKNVQQHLIRCRGLENQLPALVELIKREIGIVASSEGTENPPQPFKAIVFFTAVRPVMLFAAALRNLNRGYGEGGNMRPFHPAGIYEIHSRLTQAGRTRAAENFRKVKSGILLSSDVTARGMDFPGVTHVIQMGAPKSADTYIHRIGRTARGDRSGIGYLFLSEMEYPDAMKELRKLPLELNDSLVTAGIDLGAEQELPKHASEILTSVLEANRGIDPYEMKNTYMSLIGCYGHIQKPLLANSLNRLATLGWGLPSPPEVSRMLASRLGIDSHHGFHISSSSRNEASSEGSDGPGYGGRGGRGGRGGFGGRGGRGGRGGFGDRPPYRPSGGEEGGYERKPFRPRDDNNEGSYERKPYRPRENGDGEGDGSYERKPFRPRDDNNGSSYERKPFRPRDDSSSGYERKPFRPRNDDDGEGGSGDYERKPYRSRNDDDDGEGGSGGYERKSFAPRGGGGFRGEGGFRGRGRGRGGFSGGSDWGSGGERGRGGYQRAARSHGPGNWERGNRGRSGRRGRS